ncbi:hypothetical protein UA08_02863 [Talaromyces atroroseus]|uniref:Uncharacterized protein n=1 Tax=Talaromyces atroroseus TaxID=1441469 RepID=A0A225B4U0_TALAT|nr:hypothetical protein UA08_02863 [Talaromyces atroroseus]OKL62276.1 hypothetical protein UA08_02863 [Talaromyces atroroseus]
MNEALCSILSGEDEWSYDSDGRTIKFNQDGTGELWCRCELVVWIAADFTWKSIKQPPLDPTVIESSLKTAKASPALLGQLNLEITLVKRLPEWTRTSTLARNTLVNEHSLTDAAFEPKLYTVRFERGNFMVPWFLEGPKSQYHLSPRFELRLLFDKSPYPPRSEWKKPDGGPDSGQFWEHKEFVGRKSSELKRPINEVISAACTVS